MNITQAILEQLENRLAEQLGEHADLAGIELGTDGLYRATAFYDGIANKGYRAQVTFKYRVAGMNDVVEDFELLNFEGIGLVDPKFKFD